MSIKNRLLEFINFFNINKISFYKSINVQNGFLDKGKTVRSDILVNILNIYPDINLDWLLTGVGKMLKENTTISNSNVINGSNNNGNSQFIAQEKKQKKQKKPQEKQPVGSVFSCSSCPFVSSLQANINDLRYTIKMQQNLINNQKK